MSNQQRGITKVQDDRIKAELTALYAQIDKRSMSWGKLLPKGVSPTWFAAEAKLAVNRVPDLRKCTPVSLFDALSTCAQLGLSPSGRLGSAYLIPYEMKKEGVTICQLVIGYRGKIDLAHRGGDVVGINVDVVYDGEDFVHEGGIDVVLRHRYDRDTLEKQAPDKLAAVYAVATMRGGYKVHVVLYRADVERAKRTARGSGNSNSPWQTNPAEMWKKTAIHRLMKSLPLSPERSKLLALAEEAEAEHEGSVVDAAWTDGASTPALPASGVDALEQTLAAREAEPVAREPGEDGDDYRPEQPPEDVPLPTLAGSKATANARTK